MGLVFEIKDHKIGRLIRLTDVQFVSVKVEFDGEYKMTEENTFDIYYDEKGDFLEVSFLEPASEGSSEEIEPGIFVTKDIDSKRVTNIGIWDFKKRVQILKKILKQFDLEFPLEISIP